MEYATYSIFASSTALMQFFDVHSGGIMAISAVVTAITSLYFKKKANDFYKKNDRRSNERLDKEQAQRAVNKSGDNWLDKQRYCMENS